MHIHTMARTELVRRFSAPRTLRLSTSHSRTMGVQRQCPAQSHCFGPNPKDHSEPKDSETVSASRRRVRAVVRWASARGRAAAARAHTRVLRMWTGNEGMSTVEYAIGTIAAAAFGAVLYGVVTGDSIVDALTGIIDKALNTSV